MKSSDKNHYSVFEMMEDILTITEQWVQENKGKEETYSHKHKFDVVKRIGVTECMLTILDNKTTEVVYRLDAGYSYSKDDDRVFFMRISNIDGRFEHRIYEVANTLDTHCLYQTHGFYVANYAPWHVKMFWNDWINKIYHKFGDEEVSNTDNLTTEQLVEKVSEQLSNIRKEYMWQLTETIPKPEEFKYLGDERLDKALREVLRAVEEIEDDKS